MRRAVLQVVLGGVVAALTFSGVAVAADDVAEKKSPLVEARKLYLGGSYAEAQEQYEAARDKLPQDAALGLARCFAAEGKLDEAAAAIEAGLAKSKADEASPVVGWLHAERARLAFDAGDYPQAAAGVKAALAADAKNRLARWIAAELHRTAGRLEEAEAGYKYFVDDYNATDEFTDPDDLRYIGLGAAQYARWARLSDQFTFLVNELLPSAMDLDEDYWQTRYESGMLFLEKYNEPEAQKEFKAALTLNPRAAEVYAALARLAIINFDMAVARRSIERALEINPKLLSAHWSKADVHLANYEAAEAVKVLEDALKLNPALGRNARPVGGRLRRARRLV
ncbi:MAG: tetratricopeptide repeat protein [Pirellulales bacterium]